MFLLVWAAVTKYHKLDGLNNEYLFPTVLEAGKVRVGVRYEPSARSPYTWGEKALIFLYRTLISSWDLHPHDLI